ncbi:hypothetical protein QN351_19475, partial [Cryobacterium sp. 10C2]
MAAQRLTPLSFAYQYGLELRDWLYRQWDMRAKANAVCKELTGLFQDYEQQLSIQETPQNASIQIASTCAQAPVNLLIVDQTGLG